MVELDHDLTLGRFATHPVHEGAKGRELFDFEFVRHRYGPIIVVMGHKVKPQVKYNKYPRAPQGRGAIVIRCRAIESRRSDEQRFAVRRRAPDQSSVIAASRIRSGGKSPCESTKSWKRCASKRAASLASISLRSSIKRL